MEDGSVTVGYSGGLSLLIDGKVVMAATAPERFKQELAALSLFKPFMSKRRFRRLRALKRRMAA